MDHHRAGCAIIGCTFRHIQRKLCDKYVEEGSAVHSLAVARAIAEAMRVLGVRSRARPV